MARALDFLLRAVVGVTAVYLLWIPLAEPTLVLVARATETVLARAWSPPFITGLEVSGDLVDVRGLLFHPGQWIGRWAAGNLSIFVIGTLGLAVAVPVRDLGERIALIGGTLTVCFLVMVAISFVEVLTVAATWVAGRAKLMVLTEPERRFLEGARGVTDLLQMLLPATVAVLAYGSVWADEDAVRPGATPWKWSAFTWSALVGIVFVLTLPVAPPGPAERLARFERTADLNPDSTPAWLAVAKARELLRRSKSRASPAR